MPTDLIHKRYEYTSPCTRMPYPCEKASKISPLIVYSIELYAVYLQLSRYFHLHMAIKDTPNGVRTPMVLQI